MSVSASTANILQKLYVGYFNRPADFAGLDYWAKIYDASEDKAGVLAAIAEQFSTSPEYVALTNQSTTFAKVSAIYSNLFGQPGDVPGLSYWTAVIDNHALSLSQAAVAIAQGAQGTDLQAFNNKVAAATAFTANLTTTPEILAYDNGGATVKADVTSWLSQQASVSWSNPTADQLASLNTIIQPVVTPAQTFTLTTGVDAGSAFTGGAGNDTFAANYDVAGSANTLGALDSLNGGGGTDTLQITDANAAFTLSTAAKLTSIENVTIRGADDVTADVSGSNVTGLETISVTESKAATVTAGDTTDVSVSGATGLITVDGGADVSVIAAAEGQDVTIGATAAAAGAISVTHSNQADADIAIDGGANVTVVVSKETSQGSIKIGGLTEPTGAISLTTTGAAYASGDSSVTRGTIEITGGTTVTVHQTATSSTAAAVKDKSNINNEITQSDITVTGSSDTTSVTISQSAANAAVDSVSAVAGNYETQKVTFVAMVADESTEVNGLTFTASKSLTAAQVASAFANLTSGTTHGSASAAYGIYSGQFNGAEGSTGSVTTASGASSVTFTSTVKDNIGLIQVFDTAGAGNAAAALVKDGAQTITAVTGEVGVIGGTIDVDGYITGTDVLATVSLDGYGQGSTVASDALTTLTLANSAQDIIVTNASATTLALNIDNLSTGSSIDLDNSNAIYTTLNITTSGDDSVVTLAAAAVTALTVAGDHAVDLTGATLSALKTVTVTGSAGLEIDASTKYVTAVNTSATTGDVTATINASKATYTGGNGVDAVTLSSATISKAVSLGAGDDSLALKSSTTTPTANLSGGDGTDTLVIDADNAEALSSNNLFEAKISGFEKLSLNQVQTGNGNFTVDLSNFDNIDYVVSAGAAEAEPVSFETADIEFQDLESGQSVTVDGIVVIAGEHLTSAQVAQIFADGKVGQGTKAIYDATDATRLFTAGSVLNNDHVVFTAVTAGNVTDIVESAANAAAPIAPVVTTNTGYKAAQDETALVKFNGINEGDSVTVDGLTVTATGTHETAIVKFGTPSNAGGDTWTIAGRTVTLAANGTANADEIASAFIDGKSNNSHLTVSGTLSGYTVEAEDNVSYGAKFISEVFGDVVNLTATGDGNYVTVGGKNIVISQGKTGNLTGVEVATAISSGNSTDTAVLTGNLQNFTAGSSLKNEVTFTSTIAEQDVNNIETSGTLQSVATTDGVETAYESNRVTFSSLLQGQSVTVEGLTLIARQDLTDIEVADAFSNISANTNVQGGNEFSFVGSLKDFASDNQTGDAVVTFTSTQTIDVHDISLSSKQATLHSPTVITTDGVSGDLTVTNLANDGTLELTGVAITTTVEMDDATGASDSFNIVTTVDATDINFGSVVVADVETVTITAADSSPVDTETGDATINWSTLTLANDEVKSVVVTGEANLNLTANGAVLTSVDASALTGNFIFTSSVEDAVVIGGAGDDSLVAAGNGQTLTGGEGDDRLVVGDSAQLTGGAGQDVFDISDATTTVNDYATIKDFTSGDSILFQDATDFIGAKVTLQGTAVFQDLANAAINRTNNGDVSWFQTGGNTYVVENVYDGASFLNGTDIIVKITGLVDLSSAAFSSSENSLYL